MLSYEDLLRLHVWWPRNLLEQKIIYLLNTVQRFIDYDGTIVTPGGRGLLVQPTICGVPTEMFLAREPYILQTWNPGGAETFFTITYPNFSKPKLIVVPPMFEFTDADGFHDYGKDFDALGVSGKIIIDDMPPECIKATNYTLVHP